MLCRQLLGQDLRANLVVCARRFIRQRRGTRTGSAPTGNTAVVVSTDEEQVQFGPDSLAMTPKPDNFSVLRDAVKKSVCFAASANLPSDSCCRGL